MGWLPVLWYQGLTSMGASYRVGALFDTRHSPSRVQKLSMEDVGCNGLVTYDVLWKWTGPTLKDMARTQEDARGSCIAARE